MSYYGPEEVDPETWLSEHADEIPPVVEDEIGNGTVVSTYDVIGTDDEPSYDPNY